MSQSYMSTNDPYMSQTLIAEFLKTNSTPALSQNRVMDNIDLTRDVERRRRASRNNAVKEAINDKGSVKPSRDSIANNPPLPVPGHGKPHSQLPPTLAGALPVGKLTVVLFTKVFLKSGVHFGTNLI